MISCCSFCLGVLEDEVVLPAVLVVELADDLKTPKIFGEERIGRYSIEKPSG